MNRSRLYGNGTRIAAIACVVVLIVAILIFTIVFSIRLAWADIEFRRGTEDSVARAVRILPNNVQYILFRALQMEYAGDDSTQELQRAAALSPMSSGPRLRLGLRAEARGDVRNAETWLLDAARVDHQFEPRWTLANFYFRQNRIDDFWTWMHSALEVSYGDRRPAFDLCWRVTNDVHEILRRGVPLENREVLAALLAYVLEMHRETAGTVATELAKFHDAGDAPLLDAACTSLIEQGDAEKAAQLWTAAGNTPAGGVWNGNFANAPKGAGFDWAFETPAGVTLLRLEKRGLRVELSGMQPESARLLRQVVLLDPSRRYRLQWKALTNGLAADTGLSWTLGEDRFPLTASTDEKQDGGTVSPSKRLMPLELWYQRPTGEVRGEGWAEIREIALTPLP